MRILLVQDHVGILSYHTQVLREAGHTVRATRDGDDAAQFYDSRRFDLVWTDLWHPGLEGHKLIRHIFKKNPEQLVGVISANPKMEEKINVPRLGYFEASELLTFVDGIVRSGTEPTPRMQSRSVRRKPTIRRKRQAK
jgi:DNA-binding NtrC family response regulator